MSETGWPKVAFGKGKLLGESDLGNGYSLLNYPGYTWLIRTKSRRSVKRIEMPGGPDRRPTPEEFAAMSTKVAVAMGEDIGGGKMGEEATRTVEEMCRREAADQERKRGVK